MSFSHYVLIALLVFEMTILQSEMEQVIYLSLTLAPLLSIRVEGCAGKGARIRGMFLSLHCYEWIKVSDFDEFPSNAFVGGKEGINDLYVSRLYFNFGVRDGVFPGKLQNRKCYISFYGNEYSSNYGCEILVDFKGKWVNIVENQTDVPEHAVVGGHDEENDKIYIGRAKINNDVVIGKVQELYIFLKFVDYAKNIALYVPYKGREHTLYSNFEILVYSEL